MHRGHKKSSDRAFAGSRSRRVLSRAKGGEYGITKFKAREELRSAKACRFNYIKPPKLMHPQPIFGTLRELSSIALCPLPRSIDQSFANPRDHLSSSALLSFHPELSHFPVPAPSCIGPAHLGLRSQGSTALLGGFSQVLTGLVWDSR